MEHKYITVQFFHLFERTKTVLLKYVELKTEIDILKYERLSHKLTLAYRISLN